MVRQATRDSLEGKEGRGGERMLVFQVENLELKRLEEKVGLSSAV